MVGQSLINLMWNVNDKNGKSIYNSLLMGTEDRKMYIVASKT